MGLDNGELTLGAQAGWITFEVAVDTLSGDFAMEAGLGRKDPSGLAELSVGVRFHSRKGIGVTGDVKLGGVVKLKASREAYLVHFDLGDD